MYFKNMGSSCVSIAFSTLRINPFDTSSSFGVGLLAKNGSRATFRGVAVVAGRATLGVASSVVGAVLARAGELVAVGCLREGAGLGGEFSHALNWIAPKIISPPNINATAKITLTRRNQLRFGSVGREARGLEKDGVAGDSADPLGAIERRALEVTWLFNASRKSRQFAHPGFGSSGNSARRKMSLPEAVNSGMGIY